MKLYFHVDRALVRKPGEVIEKEKYKGESLLIPLLSYGDQNFLYHLDKLCRYGISLHGAHYLIQSINNNVSFRDSLLELHFEYIRHIYYKNTLSRFQCLFAYEDINKAREFKRANKNMGMIYEVEPSGLIFRSDMNWLKFDFTPETQKHYAMSYWTGKPFSTEKHYEPQWECLIDLPVIIKQEINE